MNQEIKNILARLKKKSNEEFEKRTDVTGHFTDVYSQGFCDGFDWALSRLEKEVDRISEDD